MTNSPCIIWGAPMMRAGEYLKAKECYLKSLDLDAYGRATPTSNMIIRRICAEEDVGVADLELAFMNVSANGSLGQEQFYDFCHWYEEYYRLASEVIIREIIVNKARYPFASGLVQKSSADNEMYPLGFPSLEERGKDKEAVKRQKLYAVMELFVTSDEESIDRTLSERSVTSFRNVYFMDKNEMLRLRHDEDKIKNCISYEEDRFRDVNLDCWWPSVLYHIGEVYRRLRLYKEADLYFREAIKAKDNYYLPYLGLALTYHALGNKEEVRRYISKAKALPDGFEEGALESVLFNN